MIVTYSNDFLFFYMVQVYKFSNYKNSISRLIYNRLFKNENVLGTVFTDRNSYI